MDCATKNPIERKRENANERMRRKKLNDKKAHSSTYMHFN